MTEIAPEITARFTPEAQLRFDEYLAHARAALAGCSKVSADDIEQDIRAHVAAEFPPSGGWVQLDQLEAVLARLGRPDQWVCGEERAVWRRGLAWVRSRPAAMRRRVVNAADRLREGPDDWRLAYLAFGLLLVGVIVFPLIVVLLPASYLLGRAAVARARERGTTLGPQRWLVYPSLLIVSVPLLIGFLTWPAGFAAEGAHDLWQTYRADIQEVLALPRGLCEFLLYAYLISGALSLWHLIIGVLFWSVPRLPSFLFCPLVAPDSRRLGGRLALIGGCVFVLWISWTVRTFPVGEWVEHAKQRLLEERPEPAPRPSRGVQPKVASVPLTREILEKQAQQAATEFLRACRNQNADGALRLVGVPFYKGGTSGNLLVPGQGPVIHNAAELRDYLTLQILHVGKAEQVPAEAIRVSTYAAFKKSPEANAALTDVLDLLLEPADVVVGVGRQGRETGRVLVRIQGNAVKVVGMAQ